MKPGKFTHAIAVLLSSISTLFAHGAASKAEPAKTKFSKKSEKPAEDRVLDISSLGFTPGQLAGERLQPGERYPWKSNIVTTVFWIGEKPFGPTCADIHILGLQYLSLQLQQLRDWDRFQ